jgi:hypothetical protein
VNLRYSRFEMVCFSFALTSDFKRNCCGLVDRLFLSLKRWDLKLAHCVLQHCLLEAANFVVVFLSKR